MTKLRMLNIFCSHRKIRDVILTLQIVWFCTLAQLVLLPFSAALKMDNILKDSFVTETDTLLFFDPFRGVYGEWEAKGESEEFRELLAQLPGGIAGVGRVHEEPVEVKTGRGMAVANLVCISEGFRELVSLSLSAGDFPAAGMDDAIPVVLGGNIAKLFAEGDIISFERGGFEVISEKDAEHAGETVPEKESCLAYVAGILKRDALLPTLHPGGELTASLDCLGIHLSELPDTGFILTAYEGFDDADWSYTVLFAAAGPQEARAARGKIQALLQDYGTVRSYRELQMGSRRRAMEDHRFEVLLSILFLLVLVFGFSGHQTLQLFGNQRKNAVLRLAGMSCGRLYLLQFLSMSLPVAVGSLTSLVIAPSLKSIIFHGAYKEAELNSLPVLPGIISLLLLLSVFSLMVDYLRSRGKNPMLLYKESVK